MNALDLQASGRTALVDGASGHEVTYRELLDNGRLALADLGGRKTLLFLLCRNDAFTAAAYAGSLAEGHAVALLDAALPVASLVELVAAYRVPWVAGPSGTGERLVAAGARVGSVRPLPGGELVRTLAGAEPVLHQDLAVLLSTSGTTGSRKLVRLSATNIRSNAAAIAEYLGLDSDERPISSLPLHYTFGLSVLNSHWLAGAALVFTTESLVQHGFWDAFRARGCTSLAGVPYTYLMLERVGFRQMDLPTLATLLQAGGSLDRRLTQLYAEYMAQRGGRFFVMYGQTEATARMAYVPPGRLLEKLGSAGLPIRGGRFRIEANDPEAGEAGVGELVYEGPNVMLGYATGPADLALGDTMGGVLKTGDIGYIDQDGFLFLVGRSKRIAKVFGLRINLDEVELSLREHGPAAVVGGTDSVWAFCAFGNDGLVAALRDELARRYRIHRSALHFRHVETIPVAASGKVDYQRVQRWIPS